MITLLPRTAEHVRIYFERTRDPEISRMLPSAAATLDDALRMFGRTLLPGADSLGRTVHFDGRYVGDIWCYGISPAETPNAMLSFCIFEKKLWGRGVCSAAVSQFLPLIKDALALKSIGAFTFAENLPSAAVLRKNGFLLKERFTEDGVDSLYFERLL